jgi:hypothetical protein
MSEILILTALASVAGIIWGFRKPAGYCRMSTAERQGFSNRLSSGLINGVVLGGIVFVITKIVLG